jgi:tricarballylate dehydrogenase
MALIQERIIDVDVMLVGGGNAALCAAIEARLAGCSVAVFEAAPKFYRGGNTRHTRNCRLAHDGPAATMLGAYSEEEFWDDLLRVTGGNTDPDLAQYTIGQSKLLLEWLLRQGVGFQPSLGGTLSLDRTNAFFLGGGRSMLNSLYRTAERLGIELYYDHEVVGLEIDGDTFRGATVKTPEGKIGVKAKSLVAACGGFEANIEWLKQYWGDAADNFVVRGTAYNRGSVLRMLLDQGVQPVGDPRQCHAIAVDARAPKFDAGIITRLDCILFGMVVNANAERFYDEGEDFWPKRYAIWGRLIADQPGQAAFAIFDRPKLDRFMPSLYRPIEAPSIGELAVKLGLDPAKLVATVEGFNAAIKPGTYDNTILDDCRTEGLVPPKSHWALPLTEAPFYAYPLRPGITFTYLGTRVDRSARMQMQSGSAATNMFAAGEVMAGNVLGRGYLAGIGMTIGSVFGRIAGQEAARYVRS